MKISKTQLKQLVESVVREQLSESSGSVEITYRLRGKPWKRKTFKSQAAFEKWSDAQDSDIEIRVAQNESVVKEQFELESGDPFSIVEEMMSLTDQLSDKVHELIKIVPGNKKRKVLVIQKLINDLEAQISLVE